MIANFRDKIVRSLQDLAFKGLNTKNSGEIVADGAFQIAKQIYKGVKIKGPRYEVIEDIAAEIEEFLTGRDLENTGLDDYYCLYDSIVCKYV